MTDMIEQILAGWRTNSNIISQSSASSQTATGRRSWWCTEILTYGVWISEKKDGIVQFVREREVWCDTESWLKVCVVLDVERSTSAGVVCWVPVFSTQVNIHNAVASLSCHFFFFVWFKACLELTGDVLLVEAAVGGVWSLLGLCTDVLVAANEDLAVES